MTEELDLMPVHDMELAYRQMGCEEEERDSELFGRIARIALAQTPEKLKEIMAALDAGELRKAGVAAHYVKGCFSHLGTPAFLEGLKRFEAAVHAGDEVGAVELYDWLCVHWTTLETVLGTLVLSEK